MASVDRFLWFMGCFVLQSVFNGLGISDRIDSVVVLGHKEKATGAAICYERCVSDHEAPSVYELFGFDLVYACHDLGSRRVDVGMDALHLCGELF